MMYYIAYELRWLVSVSSTKASVSRAETGGFDSFIATARLMQRSSV